MKCQHRGTAYKKPYCKRYGDYCNAWRLLYCKRNAIFAVFISLAIAFFAYGVIYAWQYTEDRVALRQKINNNRVAEIQRMDALEQRIRENEKTIVSRWNRQSKKQREAKLVSGKNRTMEAVNPKGLVCEYKLIQGIKFLKSMEWDDEKEQPIKKGGQKW